MQHATQVEPALFRRLEDLNNELAYIDHYPERWDSQEARMVRRAAVIMMIRHVRTLLITWAVPIELVEEEAA